MPCVPTLDATERIDMRHSMAGEWRFRYEVLSQATPLDAPVPVDISSRTFECEWLAAVGSDTVVATATIETAGAVSGAVVAVVQESAIASIGPGDYWWYLLEVNANVTTVIAHGYVTVEDDT